MQTTKEPLPLTALPLYTVADAAEMLGVSLNYFYERIRDGRISTVDLGTEKKPKLRIRADSLQQFIQDLTVAARNPEGGAAA